MPNREIHLHSGEVLMCQYHWWHSLTAAWGFYNVTIDGHGVMVRQGAIDYIVKL